jgi:hypothetical protein
MHLQPRLHFVRMQLDFDCSFLVQGACRYFALFGDGYNTGTHETKRILTVPPLLSLSTREYIGDRSDRPMATWSIHIQHPHDPEVNVELLAPVVSRHSLSYVANGSGPATIYAGR